MYLSANHNYALWVSIVGSVTTIVFGLIAQQGSELVTPGMIVALSGLITAIGGIIVGGGVPMLKLWIDERKSQRDYELQSRRMKEHIENVEFRVSDIERKSQTTLFGLIVETAPVAIVVVNPQGVIEIVNKRAEEIFGYQPSELLKKRIDTLIPARYRGAHSHFLKSFFLEPTVRAMGAGRELFALRKDGSEFPVEIALKPIETEEGTLVLTIIVDITQRKQQQEVQAKESLPLTPIADPPSMAKEPAKEGVLTNGPTP